MYNIHALEPHRAVCIFAIINFVIVDKRTHLDCHISTTKRYSTLLLDAYMLKPHDILIYVYIYNRLFNRDTTRRPYIRHISLQNTRHLSDQNVRYSPFEIKHRFIYTVFI